MRTTHLRDRTYAELPGSEGPEPIRSTKGGRRPREDDGATVAGSFLRVARRGEDRADAFLAEREGADTSIPQQESAWGKVIVREWKGE